MTERMADSAVAACVQRAVRSWRESELELVVLRGYANLPALAGGDLDVLVAAADVAEAERLLLEAAQTTNFERYARRERSAGSPTTHHLIHSVTRRLLVIDLFTDFNWRGLRFLDESAVLSSRQAAWPLDVPRPAHEGTAALLGKLLYGTGVTESRRALLADLADRDAEEFRRCLTWAFGRRHARRLLEKILRLDLEPDRATTRRLRLALLRRSLLHRPHQLASGIAAEARRLARRLARPPGVFVVLLGADGSGKSTVARALTSRLGDRLRGGAWHFHWKPAALLRPSGRIEAYPYERGPRGPLASAIHLARHWLDFLLGGWLWILPRLIAGGSIVGERYYQDMWLDPRRYRLNLPARLIRTGARCVRQPDVVLCLSAPVATLRARKQEVALEATRAQDEAVRRYAENNSVAVLIDAGGSLPNVVDACENVILSRLVARDLRRRGLRS